MRAKHHLTLLPELFMFSVLLYRASLLAASLEKWQAYQAFILRNLHLVWWLKISSGTHCCSLSCWLSRGCKGASAARGAAVLPWWLHLYIAANELKWWLA
jgi:hypothetical protein